VGVGFKEVSLRNIEVTVEILAPTKFS
jgi:hypothetical protein